MWFNFCAFLNWAVAGTVPSWWASLGTKSANTLNHSFESLQKCKNTLMAELPTGACPMQFHRYLGQAKCSPGSQPYRHMWRQRMSPRQKLWANVSNNIILRKAAQSFNSAHDLTSHNVREHGFCAPHTNLVSVHLWGSVDPVLPTPIWFPSISPSWSKLCSHHSRSLYLLFDVFAEILIRTWRKGIRIDESHFSRVLLKN